MKVIEVIRNNEGEHRKFIVVSLDQSFNLTDSLLKLNIEFKLKELNDKGNSKIKIVDFEILRSMSNKYLKNKNEKKEVRNKIIIKTIEKLLLSNEKKSAIALVNDLMCYNILAKLKNTISIKFFYYNPQSIYNPRILKKDSVLICCEKNLDFQGKNIDIATHEIIDMVNYILNYNPQNNYYITEDELINDIFKINSIKYVIEEVEKILPISISSDKILKNIFL